MNREKKINQLDNLIKSFSDTFKDDEIIYHYTTAEGLNKIIQNNEIWLTNTEFVNDTTECKTFDEQIKSFNISDIPNKHVQRQLETWWEGSNNRYIASFSKKGDSLEQWRAYGPYAIGFKANNLIKNRFSLHRCTYGFQQIKKWVISKSKIKKWNASELEDTDKYIAAMDLVYFASIKSKNENFKNEEEIRLFVVSNDNWGNYPNSPSMFSEDPSIHFRHHSNLKMPVPYVKFFLTNEEEQANEIDRRTEIEVKRDNREKEEKAKKELLPIKEIVIGPMQHQKEAEMACKMLLHEKGYPDCKINISKIPYRGV